MKLIVAHITGLASEPLEELEDRTLLEAAQTDALDEMARRGSCGTVPLLPEGTIAGPGAELLALLGYVGEDSGPPSLGALEAAGIGVPMYPRDVAFRVNLGSVGEDGVIADTTGAGMAVEDALSLMALVDEKLSTRWLRFYPGRHFAHVMVCTDGPTDLQCLPAPAAVGQALADVLPQGEGDGELQQLIWDSVDLLSHHRLNHIRREEGLPPVNLLWPWAPGRVPEFRHFALKTGAKAVVLARRLQVMGAARCTGIPVRDSGTTFAAAGQALRRAATEKALAYLHLDLAEHFEHPEEPEIQLRTFAQLDTELVAGVLDEVRTSQEAVRFVLLGTWSESGWSERPPALWGAYPALPAGAGTDVFAELALREEGVALDEPAVLMREVVSTMG